ncbi:MAG: TIGR01906 family membrane protein [Coprococcus sp.]
MTQNRLLHHVLQVLLGLILCLFIISVSVTVTLNFRPLYYADIHLLNIQETSGRSEEDIRANYDALIDYNRLFNHAPLSFPTCTMSESGRIHFEEVKHIFDLFGWMAIITLPLVIAGVILTRIWHRYLWIGLAGIFSIVLPVLLGIMIAVNWNYVFVTFHQLVFNNDYWIFDETTDPVITILPDTFFMHCALMIFALVIICSIFCLFICRYLSKKRNNYK